MTTRDLSEFAFPHFDGDLPRDRLLAALRFDLLGPEDEEEILRQSPRTRYLVGQLAPRNTPIDAVEDEQDGAGEEHDEGGASRIGLGGSLEATSIGLSVVVESAATSLTATCDWGEYTKSKEVVDEEIDPEEATDFDRDVDPDEIDVGNKKQRDIWTRSQMTAVHTFSLELGADGRADGTSDLADGVRLRWLIRQFPKTEDLIVSVFLENEREAPLGKRPDDLDYLYQPELALTSEDGDVFKPRRRPATDLDPDPDIQSAELIYRNRLEFGVGHGVAADWIQVGQRASSVRTEIIPAHVVKKVTPREAANLSMDALASESKDQVVARLESFVDDYEAWIGERASEVEAIEPHLDKVGSLHINRARRSAARMSAGIAALEDPDVFNAFQFANKAMALQRRKTVSIRLKRRGEAVPAEADISANWRPFQVGFVLQAIGGIVDPIHDDRETADLLWFPTGGGKTEAYLGLTAFTLALRRLRPLEGFDESGAGTAVIMRYTLRLLTIQQFQRALSLIAACEVLREDDPGTWGDERFTIGLWVGTSVTPNYYTDSRAALNRLKNDEPVYDKSPYQVLFCPWCGDDLKPEHYVCDDEDERTYIRCWNLDCHFHTSKVFEGIPALVVDSEIYRNPPSLLLATVDKFAQMTWNGRIQTLFGRVDRHCPTHGWISTGETDRHPDMHRETPANPKVVVTKAQKQLPPPELIIQDELHLISGPLGTLAGIYESAVDELCAYDTESGRIRPKIIASTATVRRAKRQVRSLFDRDVEIFPPLGLDASDSFFAEDDDEAPGRLYVGVFGPGRSLKTTLVRTYGALLGRAWLEHEWAEGEAKHETDSLMTLVSYFNSLRELGGAVRLIEDDVHGRLYALQRREFSPRRRLYKWRELTSRAGTSQISDTLDTLDRTFIEKEEGKYPIDVLLSSNMISVGVDIDRLGLMVVSGQPKTTAEYIQATSRVGRQHPGLIVQVYNWIRPRDISHYERFHHYHDTFYRHVEATSVTPFSERARDRALPAVLVAHSRLSEADWAPESGADLFDADRESVGNFVQSIVDRSGRIVPAHRRDEVMQELTAQIGKLAADWDRLTDEEDVVYSFRGQDKEKTRVPLLRQMELEKAKGLWMASGSLREVEEELDVVLVEYEEDV